jgi:hypothetical protein
MAFSAGVQIVDYCATVALDLGGNALQSERSKHSNDQSRVGQRSDAPIDRPERLAVTAACLEAMACHDIGIRTAKLD